MSHCLNISPKYHALENLLLHHVNIFLNMASIKFKESLSVCIVKHKENAIRGLEWVIMFTYSMCSYPQE